MAFNLQKKSLLSFFFILFCSHLLAQENISYNGTGNYILTEKTDLRRYDNGKYTGLVSRQVSSYIIPTYVDDGYYYEGNFYIWQNTVRDSYSLTGDVNEAIASSFKINSDGVVTMLEDHGFPEFRSFPSYNVKKIKKGDKWQAKAERAVDPLFNGVVTKMIIFVEYQYTSDSSYLNEPCFVISAQWATRYGMGNGNYHIDWGGDQNLTKATGTHKASILVSKISGNALVIRDSVDETFFYANGQQIQFKGTISQFTEYPPAIDRSSLIPALKRIASISPEQETQLQNKPSVQESLNAPGFSDLNDFSGEDENAENRLAAKSDEGDFVQTKSKSDDNSMTKSDDTCFSNSDGKSDSRVLSKSDGEAGVKSYDEPKVKTDLENTISDSFVSKSALNKNNTPALVTVDNTPAGIRLTIPNLQFKPDSAELLSVEKSRLDEIAKVLQTVPDCKLLIEGHTASVGKEAGELQLSKERAQAICNALVLRGIKAERIICKGSGGKKPVADNATAEGKAKNRRVEITILE